MFRWYYSIKYGIKNLFLWFRFIWNDRNYDYFYLLKLLDFKLNLLSKELTGHKYTYVGSEEDAKVILSVREALERLIEDDYCKKELNEHYKKYGDLSFNFLEDKKLDLDYTKEISEEEKKVRSTEFLEIAKLEEKRREEDISFVFDTIKENIQKWWI